MVIVSLSFADLSLTSFVTSVRNEFLVLSTYGAAANAIAMSVLVVSLLTSKNGESSRLLNLSGNLLKDRNSIW